MKLWVSKNYWWAVPVGLGILFSILLFAYNFVPTYFLYHVQGVLPVIWFFVAITYFFSIFLIACSVVCIRLYKRERLTPMVRFLTIGPFIFVFSILASAAPLALKAQPLPPYSNASSFDSTVWKSNESDEHGGPWSRQKMLVDLKDNILPGLNCEDIVSALGRPDYSHENLVQTFCIEGSMELKYSLGPSYQLFNFMSWDVLNITISSDGMFERARLLTTH